MLTEIIGGCAMLEQTAEECAELTKACLKYSRYQRNENPTQMELNVIKYNLVEECADVLVCIDELLHSGIVDTAEVTKVIGEKITRIRERFGVQ